MKLEEVPRFSEESFRMHPLGLCGTTTSDGQNCREQAYLVVNKLMVWINAAVCEEHLLEIAVTREQARWLRANG